MKTAMKWAFLENTMKLDEMFLQQKFGETMNLLYLYTSQQEPYALPQKRKHRPLRQHGIR